MSTFSLNIEFCFVETLIHVCPNLKTVQCGNEMTITNTLAHHIANICGNITRFLLARI